MEERERRRAIVAAAAALAQRETEMAPVKTDEIGTSAATLAAILQTSALEKVVAGEEVVGSDSVVASDVPTAAFTTGKNCVMRRSIIDVELLLRILFQPAIDDAINDVNAAHMRGLRWRFSAIERVSEIKSCAERERRK